MNYFEVTIRLATLRKFRRLYMEFIGFTNRYDNPAAEIVLNQMRPLLPLTIDALRRARVGTIMTQDAPARGGKKYRINVIKAIFRPTLVENFNLDDDEPLTALDTAIVKYETLRSRTFVQLFNPFFWLMEMVAYLADLPFIILEKAGFELDDFRKTSAARFIKICLLALLLAVIIEVSGLRRWLWHALGWT